MIVANVRVKTLVTITKIYVLLQGTVMLSLEWKRKLALSIPISLMQLLDCLRKFPTLQNCQTIQYY